MRVAAGASAGWRMGWRHFSSNPSAAPAGAGERHVVEPGESSCEHNCVLFRQVAALYSLPSSSAQTPQGLLGKVTLGSRIALLADGLREFLRDWLRVPVTDEVVSQILAQIPAVVPPAPANSGDPEDPRSWVGLHFILERLDTQLATQAKLWEEADGRLRTILGVIGIVFAATLGLLPRGAGSPSDGLAQVQPSVPYLVGAPAQLAIGLYFLAGLCALFGYWPRHFNWPPAPDSLRKYLTTDPRVIELYTVERMLLAFDQNASKIGLKFKLFQVAVAISTIATGLLGLAVFQALVQVTRPWGG
jgi:hypothetical protein